MSNRRKAQIYYLVLMVAAIILSEVSTRISRDAVAIIVFMLTIAIIHSSIDDA